MGSPNAPILLRAINESWKYVSNHKNQEMLITNWVEENRNTRYRIGATVDTSGPGEYYETPSPIVPVLAVVMLTITVFLLILFRQNPGLVAGTVAGCLTIIGIYLTLNTIKDSKLTYE